MFLLEMASCFVFWTIQVILLDVRSDIKQEVHNVSYLIQADNTLKNVLIVLSAEGSPRITLFNPSGKLTVI